MQVLSALYEHEIIDISEQVNTSEQQQQQLQKTGTQRHSTQLELAPLHPW